MTSAPPEAGPRWRVPGLLFLATLLSTSYVGALGVGVDPFAAPSFVEGLLQLQAGFPYSLPLLAILGTHELGHYVAARIHRVPVSPPYFIPIPVPPFGTMGAVILMPGRIRSRDALLDIGAAGPLAGLAVALPILLYGIATSPVEALPERGIYFLEGRSILYVAALHLLKGPIPDGHDIMLSPTAFAAWVGLLVTMINLMPALQLDGGHVAHALFGPPYDRVSRMVRRGVLGLALGAGFVYGLPAYLEGKRGDALSGEIAPAFQWLTWGIVLALFARFSKREHPPTDPGDLSPRRRRVAWVTLAFFVVLFMPAWMRVITAG